MKSLDKKEEKETVLGKVSLLYSVLCSLEFCLYLVSVRSAVLLSVVPAAEVLPEVPVSHVPAVCMTSSTN